MHGICEQMKYDISTQGRIFSLGKINKIHPIFVFHLSHLQRTCFHFSISDEQLKWQNNPQLDCIFHKFDWNYTTVFVFDKIESSHYKTHNHPIRSVEICIHKVYCIKASRDTVYPLEN